MSDVLSFRIHGMDCAEEVAILRRELQPLVVAPERLTFDILRGKMSVLPGEPAVQATAIANAVGRTGMRAERWSEEPDVTKATFWSRRGRTALTSICGLFTLGGFFAHASVDGIAAAFGNEGTIVSSAPPNLSILFYSIAIAAGGWTVAPRAWLALRRLRPDMNLLMTVAVIGAALIGQWFEGAVVSLLFAISLALEAWSVGRARRAVDALLAIAPPTALRLESDGGTTEVQANDVKLGELIVVRAGDRVPLDGTVRTGESQVNQAPITGESVPVEKGPGAEVFAGTINGSGVLHVEVTRLAGETTLAQIIRMVSEAQSRRAPSEQWVDRFARVYTPTVFVIAVAVAVVPPLVFGETWSDWWYRALVLLVIGCPCALVISTPVSIVSSLAAAAKHGVLVKGGTFIEAPATLAVVAMDKTGTLTEGTPRVAEVVPFGTHTTGELLRAMGSIEAHSGHPLARAIVDYVRQQGMEIVGASDVQALDGRGATAIVDGRAYWIGSHRYLEERQQETPEVHARLEAMAANGHSVVVMGTDDHVCGFVTLADAVRPVSAAAITALRVAGVKHVVMLTGDNRPTAERIAKDVGITEVQAELLPADKVAAVEALVSRYGSVAMIGDGVNDAPAMGRATIGVAMGAAGSDAAIEAADVALMSDDLARLPWLIAHSRRTLGIIRQNVVLSLAIKLLFVILTVAGRASLWAAIAADMGVSMVVIANALRLLAATPEPAGLPSR